MYKVKKKETFIPSSNGKDKLHVIVWEPQGEVRAILRDIPWNDRADRQVRRICEIFLLRKAS